MSAMGHQKVPQVINCACPECKEKLTPFLTLRGAVYRCSKCQKQWGQKLFHERMSQYVEFNRGRS